ncbi:Zinc-binding dehydrogenase family protein [Perilla frutescens var. frutescens]|nr:Zinc-binding dehydrogenase family protein [Perilla frutescens var. frutescens]
MLDAVLPNMKFNGRIAVCGMISQYNLKEGESEGVRNLLNIMAKQIRMQGFLVYYYRHLFPKLFDLVIPLIKQGKIKCVEDIAEGIESAPAALIGLFSGRNVGKQLVRLASDH